ncbi:MAG: chemotaxis response regulator protein-glutamate methylesterase [Hyphomicrobiaceae bacterium]|nr:chemotaxis response regulator protein-glutamate methylesterase [Hyphomicrobiaceae bacterium]
MTALAMAQEIPAGTASDKIKVMIVDDSAVVRGLVSRWVGEDPDMEACGRFSNGQLAVDGIVKSDPDVIVLDIEMPVMDGLTALPELLTRKPGVKVIMASTLTRKNAEVSMKALSLGATDYIPKPETNRGVTTSQEFRDELLRKIKAMVPQKKNRPVAGLATAQPQAAEAKAVPADPGSYEIRKFSNVAPRILAIGSSTGGPQALASLIGVVGPALRSVPCVITQHMPPTFTSILAEHLGRESGLPSKEGENGEKLLPGSIYVAPGGMHMAVVQGDGGPELKLYDGPMINYCKPAVDPLFESVSKVYGAAVLGLVLTGMGHDGAAGAKVIADSGGSIIAQDQATSVVWGMPGATAEIGACAAILPLDQIGRKASSLLRGGA